MFVGSHNSLDWNRPDRQGDDVGGGGRGRAAGPFGHRDGTAGHALLQGFAGLLELSDLVAPFSFRIWSLHVIAFTWKKFPNISKCLRIH